MSDYERFLNELDKLDINTLEEVNKKVSKLLQEKRTAEKSQFSAETKTTIPFWKK